MAETILLLEHDARRVLAKNSYQNFKLFIPCTLRYVLANNLRMILLDVTFTFLFWGGGRGGV